MSNFQKQQEEFKEFQKELRAEEKTRNVKYGIVHFECAMMLRKIGYDKPVNYVYYRNRKKKIGWDSDVPEPIVSHNANEHPYSENQMSAPSMSEVNEWLLRKFSLKIFPIPAEHSKRVNGSVVNYQTYNKAGTDFVYEYRVYVTPSIYNDEPFAEFVLDYLDTNLADVKAKNELDAFECGLKTICNAIFEYNKSKK